jgi:hypothetical protein
VEDEGNNVGNVVNEAGDDGGSRPEGTGGNDDSEAVVTGGIGDGDSGEEETGGNGTGDMVETGGGGGRDGV